MVSPGVGVTGTGATAAAGEGTTSKGRVVVSADTAAVGADAGGGRSDSTGIKTVRPTGASMKGTAVGGGAA